MPRIADETCWQEQLLSDPCFSESWASVQESRADADVEPLPQSGALKSWAERWDSKEAFKTLGHFETLSSRPDPKNFRSIGLPWFAAWNCEAEIAVGSIWAASAGCSWDPVPGTEVPQMQMPWVQLWSSYGQRINRTCLYRVRTRTLVFQAVFSGWQGDDLLLWLGFISKCGKKKNTLKGLIMDTVTMAMVDQVCCQTLSDNVRYLAGFSKAAGDECLRGLRGQGFQPWFLKIWDPYGSLKAWLFQYENGFMTWMIWGTIWRNLVCLMQMMQDSCPRQHRVASRDSDVVNF